jgi:hypothetical protein
VRAAVLVELVAQVLHVHAQLHERVEDELEFRRRAAPIAGDSARVIGTGSRRDRPRASRISGGMSSGRMTRPGDEHDHGLDQVRSSRTLPGQS